MPLKPAPKTCLGCKRTLSDEYFHRYKYGTRAKRCKQCHLVRPHGPKGIWKSPNPCKVCGTEIWRDEAPSRLNNRKTCSTSCANAARRSENLTCLRCKRILPFRMFDRKGSSYGRKASCRECMDDQTRDMTGGLVLRPSLYGFRRTMEHSAKLRGLRYDLSPNQAAKLHRSPCSLCGKAASGVTLKNAQFGYVKDNCRPVCRICRRLTKMIAHHELLLLAHEIAVHTPLVAPGEDADGAAGIGRLPATRKGRKAQKKVGHSAAG